MAEAWESLPDVKRPEKAAWEDLPDVAPQPAPSLPAGGDGWFEPASKSGAILRGGAQGASFGFSDELNGAVTGLVAGFGRAGLDLLKTAPGRALMRARMGEAGAQLPDAAVDAIAEEAFRQANEQVTGMKVLPQSGPDGDGALDAGYESGRRQSRLENVQARKANPGTYLAANIAGGIAAPAPGAGNLVGLAKAGRLAKVGAGMGAASALGYSDEVPDGFAALEDVATGAAAGGALAPVAGVAGDKLGPYLRRASQDNALKAIGTKAGIDNVLDKMGYETADEARSLGQFALDTGLIKPFGKAEGVMERAQFGKEATGARIEAVLSDADAAGLARRNAASTQFVSPIGKGPEPTNLKPIFDAERASWQAAGEVLGPDGLNPTAIRAGEKAQNIIEDISRLPQTQDSTFRNANRMKSDIYDGINWRSDSNLQTRMQKQAVRGLRKSIEEQAGDLLGPESVDELRAANQAYGKYSNVRSLAKDEATRQLGRKSLTSLDIAGAASAGGAAGAGGAMTVLGSKLLGSRIPSALAVGQKALSQPTTGGFLGLGQGNVMGPAGRTPIETFLNLGAKPATQAPLKPSLSEEEEDAIQAFLSGG